MKTKIVLLFLTILFTVGCKKQENVNLLYGKWNFQCFEIKGTSIQVYPPNYLKIMTIEFYPNDSVFIGGIVNSGEGPFSADKLGYLSIHDILSTLLYEKWDARFFSDLTYSKTYDINPSELKIYYSINNDSCNIMLFKR